MDQENVIKYPLATEKSIRLMESENKLVFVVDKRATKTEIKQAVEKTFNTKVVAVNTLNSIKGRKQAYITFAKDVAAIDIATNLGIM
ncbi:50S ribosomal protein L23 [Candidatus Woesearchaeota archaeon CG10_big_fil_rev_8_21_14_0_10_37_12]|nr:MAG: 50S ribosomal protein L23 [Candidatus Woesearchaeota archaeon CG10_big_fil_rev_8_21_14_0_10_37_12]